MMISGVKGRAFLLAFLPMLLITIVLSFYFINEQLKDIDALIDERGETIARHLALDSEYGVFSGNVENLEVLLNSYINEEDVIYLEVKDNQDNILTNRSNSTDEPQSDKARSSESIRVFTHPITLLTTTVNDLSEFNTSGKHNSEPETLGKITAKLSTKRLLNRRNKTIIDSFIIILSGVIPSVLLALWISQGLTSPISRLTKKVRKIEDGDFDVNISKTSSGEIGELEHGIDTMLGKVRVTQYDLQNKVDETTSGLKSSLDMLEKQNNELSIAREKALLANKTKSRFLSNMSHEIRTPMNGIIGFVRLLKNSRLSNEQQEYLRTIEKSADNLLTLINDILDISRVEAGKLNLKDILFDLEECIEDSIMLMAPAAQEKGINITNFHNPDTPKKIYAPRDRISQILINYLGNAIKFSKHGTIKISTTITQNNNNEDLITISVTDQGIGFSEEEKETLFTSFSQLDDSYTKNHSGTGLGLAISKSLAEAMGGNVGVESEAGKGSTFWFSFKCKQGPSNNNAQKMRKICNGETVLLYDSNTISRQGILNDLLLSGLKVSDYSDVYELKSVIDKKKHYDIFALSISEGEINDELIKETIIQLKENSTAKILLFTSELGLNRSSYIRKIPADLIITKPYRFNDFSECLGVLISSNISIDNIDTSLGHDINTEADNLNINLNGYTILIAEDNEINKNLLQTILKNEGITTIHASNGNKAIEKFQNYTIDLILMDIHMPLKNGVDATKHIRSMTRNSTYIPIIGVTANAIEEDIKLFKEAGMDNILIKPIAIDDLLYEIKYWLNKYEITPSGNENNSAENENSLNANSNETYNHLGVSHKIVSSLREILIADLPDLRKQLHDLFKSENWPELREKIHGLLGGIAYCDAPDLTAAALVFQASLKEQSFSLEIDFKNLIKEIDTIIEWKFDTI